ITSLTPRRPRSASERRNPFQNTSASEAPVATPSTSRRPSVFTPTAIIVGRDDAAALARLHVGGVDPEVWPLALERAGEEGVYSAIDLLDQPADLALGDARPTHRLDQVIDRPGGDAVDVGLLDHRRERLLRGAPGLQEGGEVAAAAQPGDRQLDPARPGLPGPLAVAIALYHPGRVTHPMRRAGADLHLGLHQPLGREAQHLADQVGIGALLDQLQQRHFVIGHRHLRARVLCRNSNHSRRSTVATPPGQPPLWISGLPTFDL